MKRSASVGQADQHEATAADIARERVRHRQRQSHRDRGIDGIAAVFQYLQAGFGGVAFVGDHHAVPRAHRLRGPQRYRGRDQEQTANV